MIKLQNDLILLPRRRTAPNLSTRHLAICRGLTNQSGNLEVLGSTGGKKLGVGLTFAGQRHYVSLHCG